MAVVSASIATNISVFDLANYVRATAGKPMCFLKLQKILYYIEAYHLAAIGFSLIATDFEAWMHGPVSDKLVKALDAEERRTIRTEVDYKPTPTDVARYSEMIASLSAEQKDVVDDVLEELVEWSDDELENMVRREAPFQLARKGFDQSEHCTHLIDKIEMRSFYQQLLSYGSQQTQAA